MIMTLCARVLHSYSLEEDIQVVGEFSSAKQARAGLPGLQANICICDISMPDENGLDLLKGYLQGWGHHALYA